MRAAWKQYRPHVPSIVSKEQMMSKIPIPKLFFYVSFDSPFLLRLSPLTGAARKLSEREAIPACYADSRG
jgi:hypothetical protein